MMQNSLLHVTSKNHKFWYTSLNLYSYEVFFNFDFLTCCRVKMTYCYDTNKISGGYDIWYTELNSNFLEGFLKISCKYLLFHLSSKI